jgi:hypothetical protein
MFSFGKKEEKNAIADSTAATVILAIISLCLALGAARWSWATTEEQIQLRQDFNELKNQQDQLKMQFDFWDAKVTEERRMMKELRDEVTAKTAVPKK